jgi:uncharacterized protein YjiS (DUF1127 family)
VPESVFTMAISRSLGLLARVMVRLQRPRPRWQQLEVLVESDLRDLGLDRSELSSCAAEAEGTATMTRRRIRLFAAR